uniref:Uncharacterized protein n=1 Tax=viral metagenome TaxID=1070528 RepID=A0A6M3LV45_9ZZZZ
MYQIEIESFQNVYEKIKNYSLELTDSFPVDPVIRRIDNKWILESGLYDNNGDIEITFEQFDNWFFESYGDNNYMPTSQDIEDFLRA